MTQNLADPTVPSKQLFGVNGLKVDSTKTRANDFSKPYFSPKNNEGCNTEFQSQRVNNDGIGDLNTSGDLDDLNPHQIAFSQTGKFEKLFHASGSHNDLSGDGLITGSTGYENQLGFKS